MSINTLSPFSFLHSSWHTLFVGSRPTKTANAMSKPTHNQSGANSDQTTEDTRRAEASTSKRSTHKSEEEKEAERANPSLDDLREARGGHGRSGHSSSRSGSESGN